MRRLFPSSDLPIINIFLLLLILPSLYGCTQRQVATPTLPHISTIDTPIESPIPTASITQTPTENSPQILVFYGDSSLAIGDSGDGIEHVGYSFVTNLETMLDPLYILVTANFGGHNAKWAYEHLEEKVLYFQPNAVTLWWGFDDMGGCPGIFDRDTNKLVGYKVDAIVTEHVRYLRLLIDALHEHNIPVFVMTPIPALQGQLPWSHLDEKNNIVWEEGRWCNFNQGLQLLVQAQKDLVAQYASLGKPVYLVDVWQIYLDHPDTEKMYMDVVHPASNGVQLIAERWLEVFEATR